MKEEYIKNINELDVNYLKITIIKSRSVHFAKTFRVKEKLIGADVKEGLPANIKLPQEVFLGFVTSEAMYFAQSILLTTKSSEQCTTFVIKNPGEFKRQQKRNYFRVLTDLSVKISYNYNGLVNTIRCKTYDLSAGGIKVNLYSPAMIPQNVDITIEFEDKIITTNAKLKHMYYKSNPLKASFEFMNIDSKDKDYISGYCIRKQAETINSKPKTD